MSEYIVDYELIPLKWRDGYGLSDIDLTEEIVRCRDCKRCVRYETWNPEGEAFNCNHWGSDTEPDGFCKWGERRSE